MKKVHSLLALTTLAAAMGAAQAQSVTVFGLADVSFQMNTASGAASQNAVVTDGNASSRWGMRGSEDLGGGMKANFHIEGAFAPDTGAGGGTNVNNSGANSATGAGLFGRRSTVGISASWGEIRLGRDYTPTFGNLSSGTPFGTNGVGNSGQMFYPVAFGGTTARTNVRASNSIGYFLPSNKSGITGNVMYALGETGAAGAAGDNGNYVGGRLGYAAGPLSINGSYGTTTYVTGDYVQSNVSLKYKMGPAELMYLYGKNEVGVSNTTANMIGGTYAMGAGELRGSYTKLSADKVNAGDGASQWTVGYVHNMSKRTALYGYYSSVSNEGKSKQFTVGDGLAPVDAGGTSTGTQFGIRHNF